MMAQCVKNYFYNVKFIFCNEIKLLYSNIKYSDNWTEKGLFNDPRKANTKTGERKREKK